MSAGRSAGVGGELDLEPGDLAAQLVAHLDRLALLGQIGEIRARLARRFVASSPQVRAGGGDDDQIGRVEPRIAHPPQGLDGDLLQLGRSLDPGGDEGALALPAHHEPLFSSPAYTARTVLTLTPAHSARRRKLGSRSPAASRPVAISARRRQES